MAHQETSILHMHMYFDSLVITQPFQICVKHYKPNIWYNIDISLSKVRCLFLDLIALWSLEGDGVRQCLLQA